MEDIGKYVCPESKYTICFHDWEETKVSLDSNMIKIVDLPRVYSLLRYCICQTAVILLQL